MGKKILNVPWDKMQLEYMTGQVNCVELSDKYKVSVHAIMKRASREKWKEERTKVVQQVSNRTIEKVVDKKVERIIAIEEEAIPIARELTRNVLTSLQGMHGEPIDPPMLQGLAMALKTSNSVARLNAGAVDPSVKLDVTSGGLSMHESALSILDSCRKLVNDGKASSKDIDIEALVLEAQQDSQSQNPK